jgi:hypothetical protein
MHLRSFRAVAIAFVAAGAANLAGAADYCFNNRTKNVEYFVVFHPNGNFNFVLKPGEAHRFKLASLDGVRACGSKSPMTTDCPRPITRKEIEDRKC